MTDPGIPTGQANADQIAYWNGEAGRTWTEFQERLDTLLQPIAARALEAAALASGEQVLDVGCGCGATLLELARRVGPDGHVLGVDVSAPMSARARERIAAAGLANTEVLVADAATHAFPEARFDLLFSRFGVMFFADPAAAFANLRRAMRPGGRLLFAAWRPLAENPWFTVPLEAARSLLPPLPPPEPHAPGPFAFADPDHVRGLLAEAGWRDASLAREDLPMRLAGPGQVETAAEYATRLGPLARLLAEAGDADGADVSAGRRTRVREAVAAALRPHDGPDGIRLGGSVWLASARA